MKIMTVIGARPQFVKAAILSQQFRQLNRRRQVVDEVLVHTGQHYDYNMSSIFFDELEMLPPDYNLGVQRKGHGAMTGEMLERLEELMVSERPDRVLVYGDTNSTLAGALAAAKLGITLAHVEAGLRSYNRSMPEEINRVLTDHCSDLLFAPTQQAVTNLKHEGFAENNILLSGDVMYDAALYYGQKAVTNSRILETHGLQPSNYILSTIHRAENTGSFDRVGWIMDALARLSQEITVIMPLHPATRSVLQDCRPDILDNLGIRLIEPQGYLDMLMLEKNARAIVTDSGGIQKEAFFYRVPCVTVRTETEWTELVELGWNRLLEPAPGMDMLRVIDAAINTPGKNGEPYGNGNSCEYISKVLLEGPG